MHESNVKGGINNDEKTNAHVNEFRARMPSCQFGENALYEPTPKERD